MDYRTKEYWPANTKVTVQAKLFGVAYGDGAYGAQDISSTFNIGRSQIVKADVNSFRMVVMRDGKKVGDYPASYGLGSDPERNTRSGVHVVSEKFTDKRMVSERYDYDLVEKWAVRISNNGEFIHANPDSTAAQGSSNVTHGCVNLARRRRQGLLRHRALRRPGRGHRHPGRAVRPGRRHLGLDPELGPVDRPVGALNGSYASER